ncbi:MAG: DUF4364 family protein [Clostridiales bacterium]|nr:DUF4364 family protein [Clostridiales bacterium]NMP37887.1 DUF4364 family protein [Clostridiales bacterium]
MTDFDAFQGGVEHGGLRNKNEIKILVCYILSRIEEPILKYQLADSLTGIGLVNYFEINEAVDSLISSGAVKNFLDNKEPCLTITDIGRDIASTLEKSLTVTVREKAVNATLNLLSRSKKEQENKIEIKETENGYFITFTMYGFSEEILKIKLFAADLMQVNMLKEGFLHDPVELYSKIVEHLINNN